LFHVRDITLPNLVANISGIMPSSSDAINDSAVSRPSDCIHERKLSAA